MIAQNLILWLLALIPFAIWLHLVFGRGLFWLMRERDDRNEPTEPAAWPSVAAVVPARNEADVIARSVGSLLSQDYPGAFRVILVDDQSDDGTAGAARAAAVTRDADDRIEVLTGAPLPEGWTGKLWAMQQGVDHAARAEAAPAYILFTDADIAHTPENLRKLVARAEAGKLTMVTLMARLHCATFAERLLIPAFVFFFDMLFPFPWVNDPRRKLAGAAGGCMLVRRDALEAAGGVESIRREIIDDCALGVRMKAQGPIWLGLTDRATSLRPYLTIGEIGRMVSRSAYAQLRYSPWLLAGTLIGMVLTYLTPPALGLFAPGWPGVIGVITWVMMTVAFLPMLKFYRVSPLWALLLPAIGALYTAFTVASAVQVWRGKGGMWKGRAQAIRGTP